MEKLTKKDIVNNIAEETGFTKKEITEIVNSALNQINDALVDGQEVDCRTCCSSRNQPFNKRENHNFCKQECKVQSRKSIKRSCKQKVSPIRTLVHPGFFFCPKEKPLQKGQ